MAFDIFGLNSNRSKVISYPNSNNNRGEKTTRNIILGGADDPHLKSTLAANGVFALEDMKWYTKFNRFGYINPYNETANREYLFFTKPDLNIFSDNKDNDTYNDYQLTTDNLNPGVNSNGGLKNNALFQDAVHRFKGSLVQLQSSIKTDGIYNPFMCILSNGVTSKLDLPGLSAESNESASNMYGSTIQYRSSSFKSDNGYDFSLSFTDTKYLEIYMIAKLYDEYCRQEKLGYIRPKKKYIRNRVIDNQFSIYKIIVGADGEQILYFAKLTGVYFTDVPRGDMGDPAQDGFKFSLSFHAQFVEDSNPNILSDFNILTKNVPKSVIPVYNTKINAVNNKWAGLPYVVQVNSNKDKRAAKAAREDHGDYIYLLKWRE